MSMSDEQLRAELILMITGKLIDHAIKDGSIYGIPADTKCCVNAFRPFTNINPSMLVDCIIDGEETWGEYWEFYLAKSHTKATKDSAS